MAVSERAVKVLGIHLVAGVKRRNLWAYLVAVLVSSGYAGAMSVLQPGLLQVIGIPYAQQASITGMLGAMQELVFILCMALFGAAADRYGRRPVYVFGLLFTALGFALYGTSTSMTELVIYRLIVALGSAAMVGMMVTVIADYAQNKSRGKANGLQGLTATFGAFIPPILAALPQQFVQQGMTQIDAQQATFAVAGALGLIAAIVAGFGLAKVAGKVTERVGWRIMLYQGAHEARQPLIRLSFGAAFISRGDLAVTGAFIGLWLVQTGIGKGMTPSEAMASLAVPAVLMVVTGALVGALLTGWLSDRISRVRAVTLASGLAALAYGGMFLVSDPTAGWVKAVLFVMGVAEISAFVSSQALVGEAAPAQKRGVVIGFFGVAGACGILVGTAGGGSLYASFGPASPFVLFGLLNGLVCLWSLRVKAGAAKSDMASHVAIPES